jgi:hypothetical protein
VADPRRSLRKWLVIAAAAGAAAGGMAVVVPVLAGDSDGDRAAPHRTARTSAAPPAATPSRTTRGPRGPRGPRGLRGPRGFAGRDATDVARGFTINWLGGGGTGRDVARATIPGIGELVAVCNATGQYLALRPTTTGTRTVAAITTFQGEGTTAASHSRATSPPAQEILIQLPTSALLTIVLSVEPVAGDGGLGPAPATLTVSSQWKLNDPDPGQNHCYVAGQALAG